MGVFLTLAGERNPIMVTRTKFWLDEVEHRRQLAEQNIMSPFGDHLIDQLNQAIELCGGRWLDPPVPKKTRITTNLT
jgi:hypothetical protein